MEWQTKVRLPEHELQLTHREPMLVMGSCFAEHIGAWLERNKFDCHVNPYGVLYNPMSILQALEEMAEGKRYSERDVFRYDGLWSSWMHHSSFSSTSCRELLEHINAVNEQMERYLLRLGLLLLTWGTNHAYILRKEPCDVTGGEEGFGEGHTGRLVGNCHKVPQDCFEERLFSVEEIVEAYTRWLESHPSVNVLFTVSPIRYRKYGFHESNLSKAVLLLAQDELCRRFKGRCFYFPAYELLMDELRDYRFYADDMVHPSERAVSYVKTCFSDCYFTPETQLINRKCEQIARALAHRPLHSETDVYQCFLRKIVLRIQDVQEKYPYLSGKFEKESRLCHTLLKQ